MKRPQGLAELPLTQAIRFDSEVGATEIPAPGRHGRVSHRRRRRVTMRPMRINVIGGGPAGLYVALLMKKSDPAHAITVIERDGPHDTFGWGIVFSGKTIDGLRAYDEPTHAAITAAFERWDNVDVVHRDEKITIRGNRFSGIGRLAFLNILQRRCQELGVDLQYKRTIGEGDLDSLRKADLLVAADGAHSTVRRRFADAFRPTIDLRRNKFIWLGTHRLFHGLTLTFRQNDAGTFASHAYKFSPTTSTFIVECSEATWTQAGLGTMPEAQMCAYLGRVFERDLQGHPLLTNNFVRWLNFPLIRNERWSHENVVLLGDALHTAHFSIGSGTKLALEDSIALCECLWSTDPDVERGLAEFERVRRPAVEAYQAAAWSSLLWFENMASRMHLAPIELAHELMTRSGKIDDEALRQRDPAFAARYAHWKASKPA